MFKKVFPVVFLFALVTSNIDALAQKTTIWLVRHAEKQTAEMTGANPPLSEMGKRRANDLAKVLKRYPIVNIYSTDYERTRATASPLAVELELSMEIYKTKDLAAVAAEVLMDSKGKQALVVGHSNTLIPVIKALNAEVPFAELADNDYDMLFKVIVDESGKAKLTIGHYGDMHHITPIPAAYLGKFKN